MLRKKALSHGAGMTWSRMALGKPEVSGEGKLPGHPARGSPTPAGDLGDWSTGKVAGPGRWSSGAKDAEKSAGRRGEIGRGRCISYMQRPRPIVPEGPKLRPQRHAAYSRGHSARRLRGGRAQRW